MSAVSTQIGHAIALNGILPTLDTIRDETYPMVGIYTSGHFGEPSDGAKAFIKFVIGPKVRTWLQKMGTLPWRTKLDPEFR